MTEVRFLHMFGMTSVAYSKKLMLRMMASKDDLDAIGLQKLDAIIKVENSR